MYILCSIHSRFPRMLSATERNRRYPPTLMASRGATETSKLQANVEEQLNRLLSQLKDIEEMKGDLSPEEYQSTKAETIEQLKEFDASLKKMMGGNMTLVSSLGAVQLAIQGAIRGAFKTPEIVSLFAKKQPGQLRQRLANIERDAKLGKIPESQATGQQVEILTALAKLGDPLTPQERTFLQANSDQALLDFQKADTSLGQSGEANVLNVASAAVKSAKK